MSQKAMDESVYLLMRDNLKECLKHISQFTGMLSQDPLIKASLELIGKEAGELIYAKENTAIAYYSSLAPFLDGQAQVKEPNDRALLTQLQQDPVRLKTVKDIFFLAYPRMIDSYIYTGFSAKVSQLYKKYAE